jgi:mycothiol synthase
MLRSTDTVVAPLDLASDPDVQRLLSVNRALDRWPSSEADLRNQLGAYADPAYALALRGDEPVGFGFVDAGGEAFVPADLGVLPGARRRGVGSALLSWARERARRAGSEGLQLEVMQDQPEALAFLVRRGFVEVERQMQSELDLSTAEAPALDVPDGVRLLTRAERPGLEEGMYRVSVEATRDIPGLDGEREEPFEAWRAWEIDRPSRHPDLCFVALAEGPAGEEEVVGFGSLDVFDGGMAHHGLIAVLPSWRRRGVARAINVAQIAAAKERGFARLHIESEQRNAAMRGLTASLGYRPLPAAIVLRSPA